MSTEDSRNETLGHVWVEYKGKYFDAETPNGVPSWEELPWMEEFHSKVGNYPSDIERLNEAKQVGLLYHVTSPQQLEKILNSNTLRGSYISWDGGETDFLGISTTRNKNFLYDNNKIQIVLDGDKISNNYKVMPYDYWMRNYNIPGEPQTQDEDEEIIKVGEGGLKSVKDYIIKINDFTESINEAKQVGILYHVTSPERYKQIMDQNMLKGGLVTINGKETLGISTTRNKNFKYGGNTVQIALDGDKLSNRYKIKPYDYWERNYNLPNNPQAQDEDEEIILTPSITNIKDYILTTNLNEITNQEMRYWAFHDDIFLELRKFGVEKYEELKNIAKGERLQALEHFWDLLKQGKLTEYLALQEEVRIFNENCGCNEA